MEIGEIIVEIVAIATGDLRPVGRAQLGQVPLCVLWLLDGIPEKKLGKSEKLRVLWQDPFLTTWGGTDSRLYSFVYKKIKFSRIGAAEFFFALT